MPYYVKSQREIAEAIGVNRHTVKDWLGEGAPGETDKGYDVDAIREWRRVNKKSDPSHVVGEFTKAEADARLLKAKIDKAESESRIKLAEAAIREFEARKKTEAVVHLDDVERFLTLHFAECRRVFGRIPTEMKQGYPEHLRATIEEDLTSRINIALRAVSGYCRRITELRGEDGN